MTGALLPLVAGPIARDPARELAHRELQKQIYHQDDPSFVDRILNQVRDWIQSLFQHNPGPGTTGDGMGWTALVVIVVLFVLVAAAIWWRVGNVRRNATEHGALLDEEPSTARDHRAEAERHATAGRWAEAIRERLRAIARDLEERVILDPRAGRTADELAEEAGQALPGHAAELRACVRVFDDVWYGGRTGDADGYHRLTALNASLRSARPVPLAERAASTSAVPR